jgi:hypothetical protein
MPLRMPRCNHEFRWRNETTGECVNCGQVYIVGCRLDYQRHLTAGTTAWPWNYPQMTKVGSHA